MRAPDSGIRGREFEFRTLHIPSNQIIHFFLSFLLIFLNFEGKQCANIYWSTTIKNLLLKRSQAFLFVKIANTPHKGTIRHIALLHVSSSLSKIQCSYRDENDLVPDDQHIRAKRNTLCLATFLRNDISSCLWYISSFNWKSSCVLIYYKSEDGYPSFLFSYLLLIIL